MRKRWWLIFPVLGLLALAPFPVAAMTNSEVIAILSEGLGSIRLLVQDAYCAAGVQAFCP